MEDKIDQLLELGTKGLGAMPRATLQELVRDPSDEVRFYALQTMVLDLKLKDEAAAELCWDRLENDVSPVVRGMAAGCLGSIYFASYRVDVADRMRRAIEQAERDPGVMWSLRDALAALVERPPEKWRVPREELLTRGPDRKDLSEIYALVGRPRTGAR